MQAGIITSKSFDVKKKAEKIPGDVEDVINEISKYKIKVASKVKKLIQLEQELLILIQNKTKNLVSVI